MGCNGPVSEPIKPWILDNVRRASEARSEGAGRVARAYRFVSHDLWRSEVDPAKGVRRSFNRVVRITFLALQGFVADKCVSRASALTYTTVLSVVPLLAFGFSALKGLGVYKSLVEARVQPFLNQHLGAEGQLRQAVDQVLEIVDSTNLGALGAVGVLLVLWAVLRLLEVVEASFNDIWGVRRSRSFVRKLSDYVTIVVVAPIFLVVVIGITGALQDESPVMDFLNTQLGLGPLISIGLKMAPVFAAWLAFAGLYLVLPNARAPLASVALGGVVAGTLFQLALYAHVVLQVGIANYSSIYSSFAVIPIFLVWVHASWVTVLLGAEVAFAHQNEPAYRGIAGYVAFTPAVRERIALRAMVRVCSAFLAGEQPCTAARIAVELGIPARGIQEVLDELEAAGIVREVVSVEGDGGWLPARDPGDIHLTDVNAAMRHSDDVAAVPAERPVDAEVDRLLESLVAEARGSVYDKSLREIVRDAARDAALEGDGLARPSVQPS